MKQQALSVWLKTMIIMALIMVMMVYFWLAKVVVDEIETGAPGPDLLDGWCILLLGTIVPVLAAAVYAWLIARNIGRDRSFTAENASYLKMIALLAAVYAGIFVIGLGVNITLGMPGLFGLLCVFAVIIAVSVSAAAAGLSHLTQKAALMQQENELTI